MIKIIFSYLRRKFQKTAGSNCCTQALCCMCACFIACLDRCVKFIAKNAYIQIAITGKNFCSSAYQAFCLIVRNSGRFSMTSMIGSFLTTVGNLLIAAFTAWICYIIIVESDLINQIYSPVFPMIIVCKIALLVAYVFLAVFSQAAGTILHCFLIDEEVKGGRHPQSLNEFLEVNDKLNA